MQHFSLSNFKIQNVQILWKCGDSLQMSQIKPGGKYWLAWQMIGRTRKKNKCLFLQRENDKKLIKISLWWYLKVYIFVASSFWQQHWVCFPRKIYNARLWIWRNVWQFTLYFNFLSWLSLMLQTYNISSMNITIVTNLKTLFKCLWINPTTQVIPRDLALITS